MQSKTLFQRTALLGALALLLALPMTAADYTIDGGHSSAVFKVKHFDIANFYGTFNDISGTLTYDAANPGASKVSVTIQAASVDSRNDQRDGHIKSPDFLNAGEFPVITFESTSVSGSADELQITGKITLHGVSKEITITAEKTGEGTNPRNQKEMVGFETRFSVDRTQHGMEFMAGPLSKDVEFILALEAVKN